ncbi:uncharacterized protein BXZ73DRAFT_55186 [Epithele typhae]|uniref:uncharacterized protein n=1 Tax=Epithele typhae TaxID=378194 RepID=UPI0020072844|nr:uncharacterized protein BXZ73DRAFT_55186 [Epithele typhae]KAH9914060.1 hypothetical protein BXZ73DRAFT_55186 [Epithele typhae]
MRSFALAALVAPIAVTQALDIVGPSQSAFWVFNTSNSISWSFAAGDPSPINIVIVNSDNATLNGPFSIATGVNVNETAHVAIFSTNVTLRPGDNYQVQFVNTTNQTDVFASSTAFTMKPNGSEPAAPVSVSSAASSTATSPSGSRTSSSSSATATGAASNTGGALSSNQGVLGVLAACGLVSLSALIL